MNLADEIFILLEKMEIFLTLDGDDLIARPTRLVTPEVQDLLRENKATLVAALAGLPAGPPYLDEGRGLCAKWSKEFGYVSIYDPVLGEWWDVLTSDGPNWAVSEARRRKALWKAGNRRAYDLTQVQMEKTWEAEHPPDPGLIVEEHPLEEGTE